MAHIRQTVYSFECDECGDCSNDYIAPGGEARPLRWARQQASKDGWTMFSERDLCPRHSGKANR